MSSNKTLIIQIRSDDLKKLERWGEKLGLSPERMLNQLIDEERKRRSGRSR